MASGRVVWLALLALCLGLQWTLGHFQIQTWTGGLVILTGLWRAAVDRRLVEAGARADRRDRSGASALAAVQLGPSWQFAESRRADQALGQRAALLLVSRRATGSSWCCRS